MVPPDNPRPPSGMRPPPGRPPAGAYPPPRAAQYGQQPGYPQHGQYPPQQHPQHGQYSPHEQHPPQQYRQSPATPPRRQRFGALAWTALILGIVGIVGSWVPILNNLTAVVAGVGLVLGLIALFGTRKVLAAIGVALCVAAIVFTVLAQAAFSAEIDRQFGEIGEFGGGAEAMADVTVADCAVIDEGFGLVQTQGAISITNSTDATQSYAVTVSVDDGSGNRIGEINAFANALAAGQSVTLTGMEATGLANEEAPVGPAACQVVDVMRVPS